MHLSSRGLALALALFMGACSTPVPVPPSIASPTSTPTATPLATASPTAAVSPIATPLAGVVKPTTVPLPSTALISAPSRDVVWVLVGGQLLFRSTDRGDTWQQRPLPPSRLGVENVTFVSDREGWVAFYASPGTGCQAQSVELWRTTDAGTTYEPLPTTEIPRAGCKQSLSFVDRARGFLGVWMRDAQAVILRTTDGGATWQPSARLPYPPGVSAGPGATMRVGQVRGFGTELLVEAESSSSGRQVAAVYRSADGGATWNVIAAVPEEGSTAFVSAIRWTRLSGPGDSRETTDAGASWHPFASDYQQAAPVAPAVTFADADVGYATVRGAIQRTIDGGARWTPIRTPGT